MFADARADVWHHLQAGTMLPTLADRLDQLRPVWMRDAACAGVGADAFVPARGGGPARGRCLCASCAVCAECLAYALADSSLAGTWGNTSEAERRALRRA